MRLLSSDTDRSLGLMGLNRKTLRDQHIRIIDDITNCYKPNDVGATMPYPVIFNGDHAEYEIENADTPAEARSDWPLPSFDAADWAKAFCKIATQLGYKDADGRPIDEGWMIGWFASALMRGFDEHAARAITND